MKQVYKIYGNSVASGLVTIGIEYTEENAIELAESIDPSKYYQYIIIGYDLIKNEPIFTKSRFIDYDKPKILRKVFKDERRNNRKKK
jgi:hypothetical protein